MINKRTPTYLHVWYQLSTRWDATNLSRKICQCTILRPIALVQRIHPLHTIYDDIWWEIAIRVINSCFFSFRISLLSFSLIILFYSLSFYWQWQRFVAFAFLMLWKRTAKSWCLVADMYLTELGKTANLLITNGNCWKHKIALQTAWVSNTHVLSAKTPTYFHRHTDHFNSLTEKSSLNTKSSTDTSCKQIKSLHNCKKI